MLSASGGFMFAVKDREFGKFLTNFSGSLNDFKWTCRYRIAKRLYDGNTNEVSGAEVHNEMFCLDTVDGAKLYKTKSGIGTSFYSYCVKRATDAVGHRTYERISLEEGCPWLEVVPVKITAVICEKEKT
jgi:hypothetical protein